MTHWLYVWLANPVGLLLTWRPVIYVGESSCWRRRTAEHRRESWWWWLTWGVPLVCPVPGRRTGQAIEEGAVRLLRPAANREHNRGATVGPVAILARLVVVVGLAWVAWMLWA